ncbi:hypothetical protein [Hymenobacter sp. APR13]|uniref:hypothetical protein n=1 Tax=Hymenobacter sp. APR13 TaxID=1356852 RepID=UPI0004E0871C|nr:hypothetical protein [Hymenobacter sp. APR13]AII51113.1 hypothetical protein N008_03830 [Hymenobacter sp. APR13]
MLDTAQLQQLLKTRPGIIEKMRRNARWEMAATAALMLLFAVAYLRTDKLIALAQVSILQLIGAGQLYYYYLKLGVLRRMATVEDNVQAHLRKMCVELRRLLQFFYKATLAAGPFAILTSYGFTVGSELSRPGGVRVGYLLGMAGGLLFAGALLQLLVVRKTRWYLQRLYGQHLDRLEASLRELEDTE